MGRVKRRPGGRLRRRGIDLVSRWAMTKISKACSELSDNVR